MSADGGLLEADAVIAAMLGYAGDEERLLSSSRDALHATADESLRLGRALATADVVEQLDAQWRRRDGSMCPVRISAHAIREASGQLVARELIVEDMTVRRQRDAEYRRAERLAGLGAALAGIAHELNNPLTSIIGFVQLLLSKPGAKDAAALETIHREATRSAKIVRDLLTLTSRREADRRVAVPVNETVRYVLRTRHYAQQLHGIRCTLELAPQLPRVRGDRAQLEQLLLNLVSNAEQAIRAAHGKTDETAAGQLTIRTRGEADWVVLEVEDDGAGIPDAVRERIWQPFWTTRTGAGTGLGLTVVQSIVADHGGRIDLAPHAAGERGSCFIVRLPALPRGQRASAGDECDGDAPRALDILVADAAADERSFLTRLLSARGHAVLTAASTREAVRLAARMHFDAVICSAGIAGDDETLAAIRGGSAANGAARARPRIIVAAGDADSTARLPLPLPSGTAIVMQPFDVVELLALLEDG